MLNNTFSRFVAATAAAFALVIGSAPVANAEPAPVESRLILTSVGTLQNPTMDVVAVATFSLSQYGAAPQPGTYVRTTVTSCGQYVATGEGYMDGTVGGMNVAFSPNGTVDFTPNDVNRKIGPSFEYTVEVYQAGGFDVYTYSGSYNGYAVKRPSCEQILSGQPEVPDAGDKLVVKKWSKKVSLARTGTKAFVGKKVKITKTVSNGRETYQWRVGNKVVKQGGTKFRIKQAYKGKKISVKVIASKGNKAKSKTLSFGRAKR